ncbi:hypothetical protein [Prevotella jejuni]|jgi:hypothetical protein|uniref:hypothetical protein n=1 Tax=Prevotella jejuni TaxID=1177574 RepID=UPI001BAC02E6|nr:hypothetical protein [Prevotella jejuni]QUB79740.1 hypothetical protein J4857_10255 [Prevotella jejuni]
MKREKERSQLYVAPKTKIHPYEDVPIICTSVVPQVPGSTEEEWENDQEVDGGEIEI